MKDTVRINFDFPREEYAYLKLMCTRLGMSVKEVASHTLIEELEDYEDALEVAALESDPDFNDPDDFIPWEEVKKELQINV